MQLPTEYDHKHKHIVIIFHYNRFVCRSRDGSRKTNLLRLRRLFSSLPDGVVSVPVWGGTTEHLMVIFWENQRLEWVWLWHQQEHFHLDFCFCCPLTLGCSLTEGNRWFQYGAALESVLRHASSPSPGANKDSLLLLEVEGFSSSIHGSAASGGDRSLFLA